VQDAGREQDFIQFRAVFVFGGFIASGAIQIFPNEMRNAGFGAGAQIRDGRVGVVQVHVKIDRLCCFAGKGFLRGIQTASAVGPSF